MTTLQEIAAKIKDLQETFRTEGKSALHAAFKTFFTENPIVKKVIWVQYTPYFDDGNPCTFMVDDMVCKLNANADDDDHHQCDVIEIKRTEDNEHNRACLWRDNPLRTLSDEEKKVITDFDELRKGCIGLDDMLETVFGDHVKIVATAEGFQVDEYDHE
jgi:hypothetical protein